MFAFIPTPKIIFKSIGIILSGSGKDGANGIVEVHKNNGIVLVHEPASAEYKSMPLQLLILIIPTKYQRPVN